MRNALSGFKKNDPEAWAAVNNYKKNHRNEPCSEGYAEGALNHLKSFEKSRQDLTKAATDKIKKKGDAKKAKEEIQKTQTYKDNQPDFDKYVFPRLDLLEALNDISEASSTVPVVKSLTDKLEKDYNDSDYESDLTTLEGNLIGLQEAKSNKDIYDKLDSTNQTTFNELLSGLEAKVKDMQASKKANDKTDNNTGDPGKEGG